jgi:hypothetical protein
MTADAVICCRDCHAKYNFEAELSNGECVGTSDSTLSAMMSTWNLQTTTYSSGPKVFQKKKRQRE